MLLMIEAIKSAMESLNFVNLIQAASVGVSALGGLLLWKKSEFKAISLLLWIIAAASGVNILEETGLTRDIYIISPIFIMLFGPATFLAAKHLTTGSITRNDWVHLLPILAALFFTSYVEIIIVIGTVWRITYLYFTIKILLVFKQALDEKRSDSDDFSLRWFVGTLVAMTAFNFVDLIRLNSQPLISYELNVLGQGINNAVWLVASAFIVIKLIDFSLPPKQNASRAVDNSAQMSADDYSSTFAELDALMKTKQWFLKARLTLNDVSELSGLQTRDISRMINTVANKSFNQYINEYRVSDICKALDGGTSQSLTQLYINAGFTSKASFNQVFKELTGLTPSQYKAKKV